jgi:hypothetical protein
LIIGVDLPALQTQGRNREDRLSFSELAMLSPLLGSAAHESVN